MEKITKKEIVERMMNESGISRGEAGVAYEALVSAAKDALKDGKAVTLSGLCSLAPVERAAKTVNSFGKGTIEVPASRSIKMKVSTRFRAELNK
jgi:nucleoid DNA-binding protein